MSSIIQPSGHVVVESRVKSMDKYRELHERSLNDPAGFWSEIADDFYWETPATPGKFLSYNFDINKGKIFVKWLEGAKTNVCYNLLDRNLMKGHGNKVAFFFEGNHPDDFGTITYKKLYEDVCQLCHGLKKLGVGKGDTVAIYMPMIEETIVTMLACSRIGAIHSVVFAGFSSDSLAQRVAHCKAKVLFTTDGVWRGEKLLQLKQTCQEAVEKALTKHNHTVENVVVVSHLPRMKACAQKDLTNVYPWDEKRDVWWHEITHLQPKSFPPQWMDAEDPLFMLYTSGSTGKPKGVLHTTGGYLLYAAATFRYIFDYQLNDVFWCTADVGWITGHTYVLYGPLANAATSVLFEGTPFFPDNDRYWKIIEKYGVNQFYTAPTALRALMKCSNQPTDQPVDNVGDVGDMPNLESLRILGSVGEPINPEAWYWYYNKIGSGRCSIVDTFFQTETGGHVLTPFPGATPMKPGCAGFPFFGVEPKILDEDGKIVEGPGEGNLVFARPWPGIMRTLFGDHERYQEVYFTRFPGYYCTGDGARRDKDGFLWVTGRIDDMLNVSGHLMSTSEVEGVLMEDPLVHEAAVVSKPHAIKGESLYCFVCTDRENFNDKLIAALKKRVRERIGAFGVPDTVQYAPGLPKTRSGKIMRRILKKIAVNDRDIGDTSTLVDPNVVDELFNNRP